MVELADTHALGACALQHMSSSLIRGTKKNKKKSLKFGINKTFPYICRVKKKTSIYLYIGWYAEVAQLVRAQPCQG